MTEKKLRGLLDLWQSRLGLSTWKINLVIAPCEDNTSYMEINRSINYQAARIIVSPWMLNDKGVKIPPEVLELQEITDDVIEEILVHELLHLWTRDLTCIIRNDLEGFLHRDAHELIKESANRADERCVDGLAVALCQSFRQ